MVSATVAVEAVEEEGPCDRERVVVGILGRVHLRVRARLDHVGDRASRGRRNGAIAASPSSTGPAQHSRPEDHELAVLRLGDERHRRAGHDVGDRRQLLGRRLGGRDEARDRVRGRGQEQHPADDLGQRVQPELEPRHDAEVAAAAADRPEQVRARGPSSTVADLAVGRHDLGREQVVDRQPVLAHEVADAAAES